RGYARMSASLSSSLERPMSTSISRTWSCLAIVALVACADDRSGDGEDETGETSMTTEDETGDGDGDPTGDGDGDPSGDGDGDGDPSGDGDGDPTGDGDGDEPVSEFRVGVDVRSIDPSAQQLNSIYLGGFGAPFLGGTASGIHDSIYVRSFAVGYGDDGVIFAVVDAIGMGNQWTRAIRTQVANLAGLPADRVVIATTHSHAGPDFQGLWGGVGDSYRTKVIADTTTSMLTAWQ